MLTPTATPTAADTAILTPAQQAVADAINESTAPRHPAYYRCDVVQELRGVLSAGAVRRALAELVQLGLVERPSRQTVRFAPAFAAALAVVSGAAGLAGLTYCLLA